MTDPRTEELVAESLLGEDAEKFVKSELGEVIIGMAKQEIEALHLELESVYPADFPKIDEIQKKIKNHRQFEAFLQELITKGRSALEIFQHEQTK